MIFMNSFQSALMSWRDKGFDLEHLTEGDDFLWY